MIFEIIEEELCRNYYTVDADTKEEAIEYVTIGDCQPYQTRYLHIEREIVE